MRKVLRVAPRILGILGILFISLFSLDVFEAGMPLTSMLLGFFVHNIPSLVLIAILAVAWKYERIGGSLFILVSFTPFIFLGNPLWVNVMLAVPFMLTGVLFLVSAHSRNETIEPVQ